MDLKAPRELQAPSARKVLSVKPVLLAPRALPVLLVQPVPKAPPVLPVLLARKALPVKLGLSVLRALPV